MCAGDICRPHNTQQTDLHLLGTAPPMPPPPLLQSLDEPPLTSGCGRRAYVAGRRGGPARTTRTRSPTSVVSENRHEQASISRMPQDSMHACAPCTHSNAFSKTTSQAGMRYKASSALATGRLCHAKCSCRPGSDTSALDLRIQVRATAWPPP